MATMTGRIFPSPPPGTRPPGDDADEPLFKSLIVTNPPRVKSWFGLGSLVGHAAIISALVLVPLFWGDDTPEQPNLIAKLIYNPPPPPPPPLLKGSQTAPKSTKPPQPVTPDPHPTKPEFTAPVEVPKETPLKPEAKLSQSEQLGDPNGSDFGDPNGMEGGVEGGVVGGVLGGTLGGCLGCTGDGPVTDYDQGPKPIKITKPQYPQEAFVKKIEGTVVVEILIDANGRVYPRRILTSIPALDAAAVETVKQWVFLPAIKKGRPVAIVAQAPVGFRIF